MMLMLMIMMKSDDHGDDTKRDTFELVRRSAFFFFEPPDSLLDIPPVLAAQLRLASGNIARACLGTEEDVAQSDSTVRTTYLSPTKHTRRRVLGMPSNKAD